MSALGGRLGKDMELTAAEKRLALTLDFDEEVLRLVKSEVQKPLESFYKFTGVVDGSNVVWSSADTLEGKGLGVRLAQKYKWFWEPDYLDVIHRMRSLLLPHGYMAFLTDAYGTMPCLAILKALDQYEIVRVMETSGWDYDDKHWQPNELIANLQEWEHLCDFNVIGAGYNNIKLEFKTLPQDLMAFSEEVNRLCWELDEVYGIECYSSDDLERQRAVEQLAQTIGETHKVYLWWD